MTGTTEASQSGATGSTREFNVITPQAVDAKDVVLASAIPPFRSLSDKHKRFVVAYASGKSPIDSVLFAFPEMNRQSASKYSSTLLKRTDITACITELSSFKNKQVDLSKESMAKRMMMLIGQIQSGPLTAKHYEVVVKLFDMFNKMNGNYVQSDTTSSQQNILIQMVTTERKQKQIAQDPNVTDVEAEVITPEEQKLLDAQQSIQDFLSS